jgi:hypothetical protein
MGKTGNEKCVFLQFWVILPMKFANFTHRYEYNLQQGKFRKINPLKVLFRQIYPWQLIKLPKFMDKITQNCG